MAATNSERSFNEALARVLWTKHPACPQRPQALISSLYKPGVREISMTAGGGHLNDR